MDINQSNTEDLQLASMRSRAKAFIIDDLSITLVVFLLLWDKISIANGDMVSIMVIMNEAFEQIIILKFIYQTLFIWYYGATIGKMIAKIKVIDYENFGKVSLTNAILRSMGRILSEMIFYIGFIIAFYSDSKQTFHDKIGKTLVVDV